jgi:hypothetical protein
MSKAAVRFPQAFVALSALGLGLGLGMIGSPASAQVVGSRAPAFHAETADDQVLTLETFRGRVAMLWYESRESKALNTKLKAELKRFSGTLEHQERLVVLAVANVSGMGSWPLSSFAKAKMRDVTKEIGLPLYGDWDGNVQKAYDFTENTSYFLLIDSSGMVRYRIHGKVPEESFPAIEELERKLVDGTRTSSTATPGR